jgi:hypothetical protein
MTAERHVDAVRRYLDYLCDCPQPGEAVTWAEWVRRTTGATAVIGLTFGAVACGGETGGDGQGGAPAVGGGAPAGGATIMGGTSGVLYGLDGGTPRGGGGTGGIGSLYGMPTGGTGSGGKASGGAATGGVLGTGGIGDLYGMPTGGIGSGGRGSGGATGVGGIGTLYGLPLGGMGAGGARTGGSAGVTGGMSTALYGIPAGGMAPADAGVDCSCTTGAYTPVCGADGQTHDAACGAQCVPVGIACLGQCPCAVDGGTSCNIACTVAPNSPYCDAARVSWMCKSGAPTALMLGAGCQMEPTDSIRFCCPSSFLSACH